MTASVAVAATAELAKAQTEAAIACRSWPAKHTANKLTTFANKLQQLLLLLLLGLLLLLLVVLMYKYRNNHLKILLKLFHLRLFDARDAAESRVLLHFVLCSPAIRTKYVQIPLQSHIILFIL